MPMSHEFALPRKLAIMGVLELTQFVQMMPFGTGIVSSLQIGEEFGVSQPQATWIASSYPMTQGAFILIGGRLGDVFGQKKVLLIGAAWWVVWSLVSGFAPNFITLAIFRGLTGAGGAFVIPNAVALLAHMFPPGKLRNISMGLFGAMGPIGAAGGSVFGALFVQLTDWKWLFFFLAMLGTIIFFAVLLVVPKLEVFDKEGQIDWVGAYLGVSGLILFNFVWNQAPAIGWQTPYEYILLLAATLHFACFLVWEARFASAPILPFDIWTAPSFGILIVAAFLCFMSFGILLWYFMIWQLTIRDWSLLSTSASIMPFTIGGAIAAVTAAWLIRKIAAQYILALGAISALTSSILVVTMPEQQLYWKQLFPAVIIISFCPDFVFTAAQIIASNSVPRNQQGVAGSLIGTLLSYGTSTGLGFGGTVEVHTNHEGLDIVSGYRGALYLGIGFAAASLILSLLFVRVRKDERQGWNE